MGQATKKGPKYLIEDTGFETPCWVWQWSTKNGYGQMWAPDIATDGPSYSHRVFFIRANGPIPNGSSHGLHHLCEVTECVNPDHLVLMTHAAHQQLTLGKLSMEKARLIRQRVADGEKMLDLAQEYGVGKQAIEDAVTFRSWREPMECPECGHRWEPWA